MCVTWLLTCRTYDNDSVSVFINPTPDEFGMAVTAEKEAGKAANIEGNLRTHPAYGPLVALNATRRAELAETLRKVRERRRMLLRFSHPWLYDALTEALEGRQARWQALLDQSKQLTDQIVQLLDKLGSHSISIPATREGKSVRADAVAVIEYIRVGGKWTKFGVLTPKALKDRTYFRDEITVDGKPADTHARLYMVCVYVDLASAFNTGSVMV